MKEKLEIIGMVIALLILFIFALGTIGILMLCALFGNVLGFIAIGIFDILLGINLWVYSKEGTWD